MPPVPATTAPCFGFSTKLFLKSSKSSFESLFLLIKSFMLSSKSSVDDFSLHNLIIPPGSIISQPGLSGKNPPACIFQSFL